MSGPVIDPNVRRRIDRFITKKRRQGMPEETVLQIMIDTLIDLANERDGDTEAEPDVDGEDGGDGHPNDLRGRAHLGPGDAADAEENGDKEENGDRELDLSDDEPSHNNPVTEGVLGQAIFTPRAMRQAQAAPLPVVLPEPPAGYVAIRVLQR